MADIITYPLQGITYDADDAAGYFATRQSGVYSAEEDFAVAPADGLSVTVSAGHAWVHPSRWEGYSIIMQQPTTLTLTDPDPVRSRIDRVVLRYDAAARKSSLLVLEGVPDSAGPVAPAITRTELIYDLCLAEIKRTAGSTAVTVADIYDTRADETVCGVMRDGVTGIPAAALIQLLRQKIAEVDSGNFYTKEAVDSMLAEIQAQLKKDISAASAIAESGAGYIRYSDGTQICYGATSTVILDKWTAVNRFTFPVSFIDASYCVSIPQPTDPDISNYVSSKDAAYCNTYTPTSNLICIGRWK